MRRRGKIRNFIQNVEENRTKKKMEKEREKRRSGRYGQVTLKHSHKGAISCMLAGLVLFLLALLFSVSYVSKGKVSVFIGVLGLAALWAAVSGILKAKDGLKEKGSRHGSCRVGIISNSIFAFILIVLFIRGLM